MIFEIYNGIMKLSFPLIRRLVSKRDLVRGVEKEATLERWGQLMKGYVRPSGYLVWIHAASVGESISILPLIELITSHHFGVKNINIHVTVSTPNARQVMLQCLPKGSSCSFVPYDIPLCINSFLDTCNPDFAIWIESELWPNLITSAAKRQIPMALINARMSLHSFKWWKSIMLSSMSTTLLSNFSLMLCQSHQDRLRFLSLGAKHPKCIGNLKLAGILKMHNSDKKCRLLRLLEDRSVWMAASTHEQEEMMVAGIHAELVQVTSLHNLLTVIVPRHPERCPVILRNIQKLYPKLRCKLSSKTDTHESDHTDIYIVDEMGQLDLYFAAIKLVLIGGSLVPVGGHNVLEPLRLGCAVLHGPNMDNFEDIILTLRGSEHQQCHSPLLEVQNVKECQELVAQLLQNPLTLQAKMMAAEKLTNEVSRGILSRYETELACWIRSAVGSD